MCRGNNGQRVSCDAKDRAQFLERLGAVAVGFRVEIHAYALMGNHVHLFVRTRVARVYKVGTEELREACMGRRGNEARQVALWHARERCGSRATVREIGKEMGGITGGAVSMACRRIACRARRDTHLGQIIAKLTGAEWGQAYNVQYELTKARVNAIIGIWHDHCA